MKADRRIVSSSLSARIVAYLLKQGHSQANIAHMLGVSQGFVSLVKSRERGLTLDHLERVCLELSVPLGVFLLAATKPARGVKYPKELFEMSERIVRKCDAARAAIMNSATAIAK